MKESGDSRLQRYQRQMLLPHLGEAGQRTLLASKVVIIGCGGLGGTISQILARAGVGELTLCDADTVQLDNLHRQILFDEQDVGKPKAIVVFFPGFGMGSRYYWPMAQAESFAPA